MAEVTTNAKLLYTGSRYDTLTVGDLRRFVANLEGTDDDDEITISFEAVADTAFTFTGGTE